MNPGDLIRIQYDFHTEHPEELTLSKGDVVSVTRAINSEWLEGNFRGKCGSFPSNFGEVVRVPFITGGERLFVAVTSFVSTVDGDLPFSKGDLIVGVSEVDANWWNGKLGSQSGIFPLTHVYAIVTPSPDTSQNIKKKPERKISFAADDVICEQTAKALLDYHAQLDEELSFNAGDVITIKETIDTDWYIGECHGQTGMFLSVCVELLGPTSIGKYGRIDESGETETQNQSLDESGRPRRSSRSIMKTAKNSITDDHYNNDYVTNTPLSTETGIISSFETRQKGNYSYDDFKYFNDDVTSKYDDVSSKYDDRKSPQNYDDVKLRSSSLRHVSNRGENRQNAVNRNSDSQVLTRLSSWDPSRLRSSSYTSENTSTHDIMLNAYGKTLFPFEAESGEELTFMDNEIVMLIKHVDEEWIMGEIDGKRGIFPANFVDVIVDCPYDYDTGKNDSKSEVFSDDTEKYGGLTEETERYGFITTDYFSPETDELNVSQGDTITIIKVVDENWCEARDDDGNRGYCPLAVMEIVADEPLEVKTGRQNSCSSKYTVANHTVSSNLASDITSNICNDSNIKRGSHTTSNKDVNIVKTNDLPGVKANKDLSVGANEHLVSNNKFEEMHNLLKTTVINKRCLEADSKLSDVRSSDEAGTYSVQNDSYVSKVQARLSAEIEKQRKSVSSQSSVDSTPVSPSALKPKPVLKPKPALRSKPVLPSKPTLPAKPKSPLKKRPESMEVHSDFSVNSVPVQKRPDSMEIYGGFSDSSVSSMDSLISKEMSDALKDVKGEPISMTKKPKSLNEIKKHSSTADINATSVTHQQTTNKDTDIRRSTFYNIEDDKKAQIQPIVKQTKKPPITRHTGQSKFFIPEPMISLEPQPTKPMISPNLPKEPQIKNLPKRPPPFTRQPSDKRPAPPRPNAPKFTENSTESTQKSDTSTENSQQLTDTTQKINRNSTENTPKSTENSPEIHPPIPRPRVPSRPAPPLPRTNSNHVPPQRPPQRPPPRNMVKKSPSDLMGFLSSPSMEDIQATDEMIADVQKQIDNIQDDLQQCQENRDKIQQGQMENSSSGIHENIAFYEANIQGLTDELNKLNSTLTKLKENRDLPKEEVILKNEEEEAQRREERKKEMKIKRSKVIDELYNTEKAYHRDLSLCITHYLRGNAKWPASLNHAALFGNMEEIVELSEKFIAVLENSMNEICFEEQIIGQCFIASCEDMKKAYAPYCKNHDNVHAILEKNMDNAEVQAYLDTILERIKLETNVFDLASLLIKPVQRILKYPLLLNELLKCTEDTHPDKVHVLEAVTAMTDVATAINEYKRGKDLVYKYRQQDKSTRMSNISFHSIKKKSARIKERLSNSMGYGQTKDETYEKVEARYRCLERTIRVFVRDVECYVAALQENMLLLESIGNSVEEYYAEDNSSAVVIQFQHATNHIATKLYEDLATDIDKIVTKPLHQLIAMFAGPSNVCQKRGHKLLDYDNICKKTRDLDPKTNRLLFDELQTVKGNYEALNAQLLDELPKLCDLSLGILNDCRKALVLLQTTFVDHVLKQLCPLLELLPPSDTTPALETFHQKHTAIIDKIAALSFIPRGFSSRQEPRTDRKPKRHTMDEKMVKTFEMQVTKPQTQDHRTTIRQSYASDKLYRVSQNYGVMDVLDIAVYAGDTVGLIKDSDPMGNKARWYVDRGDMKGFVPNKFLEPDQNPRLSGSPQRSTQNSGSQSANSQPQNPPPAYETYVAEFKFDARSENEVSLSEGDHLNIVTKHDQNGNPEWWWVDKGGRQGYVPAAYLIKVTHPRT